MTETAFQADDEVFCDTCYAGVESPEHFRRCVVPAREIEDERNYLATLAEVVRDE